MLYRYPKIRPPRDYGIAVKGGSFSPRHCLLFGTPKRICTGGKECTGNRDVVGVVAFRKGDISPKLLRARDYFAARKPDLYYFAPSKPNTNFLGWKTCVSTRSCVQEQESTLYFVTRQKCISQFQAIKRQTCTSFQLSLPLLRICTLLSSM